MHYKSVTTWQGEREWEVTLRVDGFDEIEGAARFGNQGIDKLWYYEDKLFYITKKGGVCQIQSEQLVVSRMKPESKGKLMFDATDFEPVDVRIEEFANTRGLDSGFESLGYGVEDRNGNPVDFSEFDRKMAEEHEQGTKYFKPNPIYSQEQLEKICDGLIKCLEQREL